MSVANKTTTLITGVIAAVILFVAAPVLYSVLTNATGATAFAAIPLVGPMATIIGLLFGAAVLIGGIYGFIKLMKK